VSADVSQAPPEKDAYFKKADGTPVTGIVRGADGKFQRAESKTEEPAKTEAEKPAEEAPKAKPVEPEKKPAEEREKSIGEAWREVKEARREAAVARADAERAVAEANKLKAELEAERAEVRGNFRGWLSKQNLSLRQLIEEDLKEQDEDPTQRELRSLKAELASLKAERESEKKARTEQTEQVSLAEERQQIADYLAGASEEYPYIAAYGAETAAREIHSAFYAHLRETGEHLDVFALFKQAEGILADNAARLAAVKAAGAQSSDGKRVAEEPDTAAGAQSSDGKRVAEEPDAGTKTLTNRTAATTASGARALTRDERIARAAARLELR
jgi:hypothetical protein